MILKPTLMVALALALMLAAASRADARAPNQSVPDVPLAVKARPYEPYSRRAPADLGRLSLSRERARFAMLNGAMTLRYAAHREADSAQDSASGDVYEVLNADDFARRNKPFSKDCDGAVRWLILSPADKSGLIWVWFLTTPNWKDYRSDTLGMCRGDTFYPK